MKKYFYIGMAVILLMAISLVAYGAFLNQRGETIIAERMSERRLPVTGFKVERRDLRPVIELETANLYSEEMTDAVAKLDGQIVAGYVQKNASVRAGQVLFLIDNEQLPLKIQQADSAILKAQASVAQATNSFHRYGRLMAKNATSKEKYDEAEANFNAANASLSAAIAEKNQLEVMYSHRNVTAPIDGEVLIMYRQPGSYVQTGTPLALIGKFQTLLFAANLNDSVLKRLVNSSVTEVHFPGNKIQKAYDTGFAAGNRGGEQIFTARVREITPDMSEPAAVRRVLWEVDNSARLLEPQTYSGIKLQSSMAFNCLAVPLTAMVDSSRSEVYVLQPDGTIKVTPVVTGADDGNFIEIISGLQPGDIVITSKPQGFEDGMHVEVNLTQNAVVGEQPKGGAAN